MQNTRNTHDAVAHQPPVSYRADRDHEGRWCVWQRVDADGWITLRRCTTAGDAFRIAASLNRSPAGR